MATSNDLGQFYRIVLTVSDSDGGSTTVMRDVTAEVVSVNFASHPAGAPLTINGQPVSGPISGIVGTTRTIAAPPIATVGDYPVPLR